MVNLRAMREFTESDQAFIRRHINYDMSPSQFASYFNCTYDELNAIFDIMGVKRRFGHLVRFCTPYPPQVAKSVKKFNWATHYGEISNGKDEVHPADSD